MSIGVIFESDEWSNREIGRLLSEKGHTVEDLFLPGMPFQLSAPFSHDLFVNRVFPSASLRSNFPTLELVESLYNTSLPIFPDYSSYRYDTDKLLVLSLLKTAGFNIPETTAVMPGYLPEYLKRIENFPVILKPNCGGRSFGVFNLKSPDDWENAAKNINVFSFYLVQEYILPPKDYTIRVEIVENEPQFILKRYTGREAISSYSRGSKLEVYDNFHPALAEYCREIVRLLRLPFAGIDLIETENGSFTVLDVNISTNFTPDYIDLVGYNPLQPLVDVIDRYYRTITKKE